MTELHLLNPETDPERRAQISRLNLLSFPEEERLDLDSIFPSSGKGEPDFWTIEEEGRFAGFFMVRRSGKIVYIAYFAVEPALRGRGIGSRALRRLTALYPDCQTVVDFEAPDSRCPNNGERVKRRNFYLRNGFFPTGWYQFYMQNEFEIASASPEFDKPAYDAFIAEMHARYPDFDPHPYRKDGGQGGAAG